VEYADWAPVYRRIAEEFGFPWELEEIAGRTLRGLLRPEGRLRTVERLRSRIADRTAVIVGLAPGTTVPALSSLGPSTPAPVLIAADGATELCLSAGIVPDIVVTDLDGPVPSEITANSRGAFALIHAHGDNREAMLRWVREFPGATGGSWAGSPGDGLVNFGGFTDGDRAAFLAEELGASQILLAGFDFTRVEEPDEAVRARKLRKLSWARELLELLVRRGRTPIEMLRPDGTQVPFPVAVEPPSTQ
jgi:2-amino-4-hydroxy-6-hydroxymethyldihydropteridine diphosphokinase